MTHTKGEWKIEIPFQEWATQIDIFGPKREHIGSVGLFSDKEEQKANAQLIASAPDLLEACKSVLSALKEGRTNSDHIDSLQQAINKVEKP